MITTAMIVGIVVALIVGGVTGCSDISSIRTMAFWAGIAALAMLFLFS